MSNYLQYVLSLKDQMSAPLKNIGVSSEAALDKFAHLEKQSKEVSAAMKSFGGSIGSLKMKLDLLRQEKEWIPASNLKAIKNYTSEIQKLEREIDKLDGKKNKMGSGGGSMLGSIVGGNLISGLISKGAGALIGGVGTSISSGMDAAKNKASFETLSGKDAGGKLFGDVQKFAQQSIFGNELFDNAKMMRSFGIETEKIMPNLKMLGDISMGDKEKLQSLTLAFSQVSSAGKLQGQDLLQMINAGFNPLNEISKKTGKSYADLRKQMEDGGISFKMVEAAFKSATGEGGMFFNMTQKIAETPFGKWEAFKGQLQGIAMQFGTALLPLASSVIDIFSKLADNITPLLGVIQPLLDALGNLPLESFINGIMGLVAPILAYAIPAFQTIINSVGEIWNALAPTFEALQPIIAIVAELFFSVATQVAKLATTIIKILAPILTYVATILKGPLWVAMKVIEALFDALFWAVDKILWPFKKLGEMFGWLSDKINELFGSSQVNDLSKNAEKAGTAAANSFNAGLSNIYGGLPGAKTLSPLGLGAGIAPAKIPGNTIDTKFPTGTPTAGKGGKSKSESVATGGTKNTTIHISIGKQIESLTVMANNIQEGASKIRDIVLDEMTRAIAMSQAVAE